MYDCPWSYSNDGQCYSLLSLAHFGIEMYILLCTNSWNYYPQIRLPENIKARKYKLSLDINWDKWDYSGTQEVSDILKFDKDYLSVANEI